MPQFENTQSFSDLFRPPEGYHTDFVAMTTFTLSLRLLVQIPALIHCGETGTRLPRGLGAVVRARKYQEDCDRFRIYYDGKTKAAVDQPSFYGTAAGRLAQQLLATRCIPVRLRDGLFHPKILLFQFADQDGHKFFRVHISSRNLTMGQLLEAGVTLETVADGPADTAAAEQLAYFWQLLPGAETTESPALDLTALRKTTLKLCDGNTRVDCSLWFGGLNKLGSPDQEAKRTLKKRMEQDREQEQYTRLRVISMNPEFSLFGKDETVEYLCNFPDLYEKPETGTVWKRKENLPQAAFVCGAVRKRKSDSTQSGSKKDKEILTPDPTRPRSLHIKEYLFSGGNQTEGAVWIGSANCSRHALEGHNVEVLVHYKVEKCSVPDMGGRSLFDKEEKNLFCYARQHNAIADPQLSTDPADRFLKVRLLGEPTWNAAKGTLKVALKNGECQKVSVWLPRVEPQTLPVFPSETVLTFSIPDMDRYSLVLLLQKEGEDTVYTMTLGLSWDAAAGSRKELISKVPLAAMESVKELVPVPEEKERSTDEAYERIQRWLVGHPDREDWLLEEVLENCRIRLQELREVLAPPQEGTGDADDAKALDPQGLPADPLSALKQAPPEEDTDDARSRYESAISTALFHRQIRELEALAQALQSRKGEV